MLYRLATLSAIIFLFPTVGNSQLSFSEDHLTQNRWFSTMDSLIEAGSYGSITSVLVAQEGNVIYEKYYEGHDLTSKHNVRSGTKTIATLLTGIAIKKGFITSEQDPILKYLQHKMPVQNPDPRKAQILIEDLLTMSSVLECNDWNTHSRGNEERMYIIEDWLGFYLDLPIRSYPFEPKPEDQPYGRSFSYCSAGAAAVAEIVQSAVNEPLHEFAAEQLFKPLGIEDYELDFTPTGTLNTAGGSEYRSRDFLKLIQLCLNGGTWNNRRIIPADWLTKATSPQASVRDDTEYGYLFWLKKFGANREYPAYYMSGNGGHKIAAIPSLDVTIVITTTNYGQGGAHAQTDELVNKYILRALER